MQCGAQKQKTHFNKRKEKKEKTLFFDSSRMRDECSSCSDLPLSSAPLFGGWQRGTKDGGLREGTYHSSSPTPKIEVSGSISRQLARRCSEKSPDREWSTAARAVRLLICALHLWRTGGRALGFVRDGPQWTTDIKMR